MKSQEIEVMPKKTDYSRLVFTKPQLDTNLKSVAIPKNKKKIKKI